MEQHIQAALRLGSSQDLYYYSRETMHKQSIATVVDNRFKQALFNLSAGSSTFIISPDQGLSDVLLYASLPAQGVAGVDYSDLAVARGWLYALINRFSIRYAGSSQYFWTGAQMMIAGMREMPNPTCRDALFQLGGAACVGATSGTGAGSFVGDALTAYAYIKCPHNTPNGSLEKALPFPTELLAQPVVITVELNPVQSIFSSAVAGGSLAGAPTALDEAYFQIKQVHAYDRGELMVSGADRSKAYSFPLVAFYQNEIQVNLASGAGSGDGTYDINLTGFRNGEVRSIIMWLTDNADTSPATGAAFAKNYFNWALPRDVQLQYNGQIYYDAPKASSEFWNLVSTETPSNVANSIVQLTGGNLALAATTSKWIEIPFSQVYEQLSGQHMYVAGMPIKNAVVNLKLTVPDETKSYVLHVQYAYNCVMMVAGGSADYAF
jgi:hypothetical protein